MNKTFVTKLTTVHFASLPAEDMKIRKEITVTYEELLCLGEEFVKNLQPSQRVRTSTVMIMIIKYFILIKYHRLFHEYSNLRSIATCRLLTASLGQERYIL